MINYLSAILFCFEDTQHENERICFCHIVNVKREKKNTKYI